MFISTGTETLARQLKALADPRRLRIVALCQSGELSVGELASVLGESQPRVSQQLKLLCEAGLLQRFRDGRHVFYRLPESQPQAERKLLALIDRRDPQLRDDRQRLRALRGPTVSALAEAEPEDEVQRALARAFIELTLAAPLGDLLDVGCGRGRILKLLASRANRAVGVDLDSAARNLARAELFLAGLQNCSLRQGDMYRLEFDDASFDTVVLDDVLGRAAEPERALAEARRVLKPAGRLLALVRLEGGDGGAASRQLAAWSKSAGLRLARPRTLPVKSPQWLLSVMTAADSGRAAA